MSNNCGKRFKSPPHNHLKKYEFCRKAARASGKQGYSNVMQSKTRGISKNATIRTTDCFNRC